MEIVRAIPFMILCRLHLRTIMIPSLVGPLLYMTTAENGKKALELLGLGDGQRTFNNNVCKVNLIITDYCMPGMTGYELLKKIKESPSMKHIPVVVVSSENVPTRIKKCLDEGAQEFMLKPLQLSDVTKLRCQLTKFSNPHKGMLCMGR
ncbi:hypothetical protein CIPAW_13G063400 [Carya illinoinensis]|uniref:Response regulatory domain-containing protein n=1 Tax=Carya illinoinensis TaxID=32201 RepID=A0A8T1NHC7_CARIL|nr:hypothetical protein CIPAW_13G063400 [Carya illinoinensis]